MNITIQVLTALYAAHENSVSVSQLARRLGVTRNVVLEEIDNLRQLGYVIEDLPQQELRLVQSPDVLMADDLTARLTEAKKNGEKTLIGNHILVFEKTASTNDVVQRLASEGHPEGLVVFAESQFAGRGRQGRNWISPPYKGLWFTLLLRPHLTMSSSSRLTVMAAAAVCTSLRRCTQLPLHIKWPNDILCNGHKVAGILVELSCNVHHVHHVEIGIGIDVNMEKIDFPMELHPYATSLKIEANHSFHRPSLAVDLLKELDRCQNWLSDDQFHLLLERWVDLDETLGRQISITWTNGKKLQGFASNLDTDGALVLRTDEGRMERILDGDVTLERI